MANELVNIGSTYQLSRRLDNTIIYLKQAIQKYHQAGYGPGEGKALYNLGNVYLSNKEHKKAKDYYQKAKDIFIKFNMSGYTLMARHQLISADINSGNIKNIEKNSSIDKRIQKYKNVGDMRGTYTAKSDLIDVSYRKKEYFQLSQRAKQLLDQLLNTDFTYLKNMALADLVRINLAMGELKEAEHLFDKIKMSGLT